MGRLDARPGARANRRRFVAACVQMHSGADKAANLAAAVQGIETAVERDARLVVLPEVFSWRGAVQEDESQAEAIDGPTITHLAEVARRLRCTIVAGSILERAAQRGELPSNTSVVLGEDGHRLGVYRKI